MNKAIDLQGTPLVVLTRKEYESLVDDTRDGALAAMASMDDLGKPALPAALAEALMEGKISALSAWRQAAGLTQADLARKAGLRTATISDIEGGKIDPRLSTLKALAGALGLDFSDIAS